MTSLDTSLIIFQPSGRQGRVETGITLLDAARQLGVDVDSVCGGRQTCGKCKVIVERGEFAKYGIQSDPQHVSAATADENDYFRRHPSKFSAGGRLSCVACIAGDVVITVPPESQQRKQVIGKSAGNRPIEIDPILHQYYVEVEPHTLGERRGDWERLQEALAREWGLQHLTIDIVALRQLTNALKAGKHKVTVTVYGGKGQESRIETQGSSIKPPAPFMAKVLDVRGGFHEGLYGLAVDVGSTTVAAHLIDLTTGETLATEAAMNPQVSFGEDLMSRVSYVMMNGNDGLRKLTQAVIGTLNTLVEKAAKRAKISVTEIYEAVIVGNTVMHALLLGIDPTELGAAPFTLTTHAPIDVRASDLGLRLHPAANVYLPALEAGHVGSDNLGVLIAEAPERQDAITLLIDIGTNAEIVLGNRNGLWSCSSPTGPAFEGGQIAHGQRAAPGAIERVRIDPATGVPKFKVIGNEAWSDTLSPDAVGATGICGSGIIEVVAELFRAGLLRSDGRFVENLEWKMENGKLDISNSQSPISNPQSHLRWQGVKAEYVLATAAQSATGKDIVITQDDVRNIQLAKAALHAGCKLLMNGLGVSKVDKIVLAGAFGSYIDPLHAMILGLIPDCDLATVVAVGNAAGDGARIALLNKTRRAESAPFARDGHYIETAIDPNFQQEFVGAMHLPHMTDPYPTLRALGVLPAKSASESDGRSARRERRRERQEKF
ncbi:MAG: ASKHA domain-containing protein [Anaerolineae bacterium]|nr:ASKHA domain-containing protein [Anaerolineae bacterium]